MCLNEGNAGMVIHANTHTEKVVVFRGANKLFYEAQVTEASDLKWRRHQGIRRPPSLLRPVCIINLAAGGEVDTYTPHYVFSYVQR